MLRFVANVTDKFTIGPEDVQVGLLSFSSLASFQFYLNTHSTNASSLLSAIDSLSYNGSNGTDVASALNAIRDKAFTEANGARPASEGVPKVVIVITNDKSDDYNSTVLAAAGLHNDGYIVFAVGFGDASINELNKIASSPAYASLVDGFDQDELGALEISISQEVCVGKWQMM